MFSERTSVGLDVHARSIVGCGLGVVTGQVVQRRLVPTAEAVLGWLGQLPGPVAVAYEAGPTGFGLARQLRGAGVRCVLAAPPKLTRPTGDRLKTDARDALHLARLLRMDQDVAVRVPDEEQEAARDLVRAREDTRGDLMRHDRYEERGDFADLEAAVAAYAAAQSSDDPLRAGNQANALTAHFGHVSDEDSLDKAVRAYLDAVARLPRGHIHWGNHLSNLGSMWFERFQRTHDLDDLEKAIAVHEKSVRSTPPRHVDRSRRLINLAMALDSRYERTGARTDLDRAIELHRSAYRTAPPALRHHHAAALGIALHLRFHLRGGLGDLTEGITLQREAVTPRLDHPDRPRRQTLLASSLITRLGETGDPADVTAVAFARTAAGRMTRCSSCA